MVMENRLLQTTAIVATSGNAHVTRYIRYVTRNVSYVTRYSKYVTRYVI